MRPVPEPGTPENPATLSVGTADFTPYALHVGGAEMGTDKPYAHGGFIHGGTADVSPYGEREQVIYPDGRIMCGRPYIGHGQEYQDEPDIRPQPTGLDAARDLLADISTAALAMIDIIEKGEGRHEEGDDGETVSAYVDQAARPVAEELRDGLRRWGE